MQWKTCDRHSPCLRPQGFVEALKLLEGGASSSSLMTVSVMQSFLASWYVLLVWCGQISQPLEGFVDGWRQRWQSAIGCIGVKQCFAFGCLRRRLTKSRSWQMRAKQE